MAAEGGLEGAGGACGAVAPRSGLRCRPIAEPDLDGVVALLRRGFPDRSAAYWSTGLARQAARALPDGVQRYGHLLDAGGTAVGVVLTLWSPGDPGGTQGARCNLSSWYVDPPYRGFGVLLDAVAMRDRRATYVNVSPAPQTLAMHRARGFAARCGGQSLIVPALSRPQPGYSVRPFDEGSAADLAPREAAMLRDHAGWGCVALVCADAAGVRPAILVPRRLRAAGRRWSGLPCLQMIHGPAGDDLAPWAGSLGRHLLRRHRVPWVLVDAEGPIPGTVGRHWPGRKVRCARGPHPPALGDLAYTEIAIFGP